MKKHIPTITIFIIIIGVIALGIWYSDRNSPLKQLVKLNVYSKEELSFLEEQGFLNDINSENLPSNKEQIISLFKSPNLIEQNLNSPDESFEVLATKLDKNTYQLAFKLENKSNQSKEFYLIPISESSQTEFKEIKGVVKGGKVSWGNQGDWGYDIEKHKQELRPELARAYDDIDNNGYTGKPIKLVLEANSTLLAQSRWEIRRDSISTDLEPIYLLVYGSAGGVKDELTILTVHSSPQQGENWEVSFTTRGTADLTITPDDQATIDDMDFISLKCGDKERTPQILENDVIFYPNWFCFEKAEVVHIVNVAAKHTLKFQFGEQTAYAYNNPGLIDNLVSYWKLDDNTTTSTVLDAQEANNGTVINDENSYSSEQSTETAKIVRAFDLDGLGDRVKITGFMNASPTTTITVSLWAYVRDGNSNSVFRSSLTGATQRLNAHLPISGVVYWDFGDGSGTDGRLSYTPPGGFQYDTWQHWVFISDDTGDDYQEIFRNGVSEASDSNALSVTQYNGDLYFGRDTGIFDGIIDEVGIWNRALTSTEVKELYNLGNGLAHPFEDPAVSTLSPLDNATGVGLNDNLVITFNEIVNVESGNITIKKTSDDSEFEVISVTDVRVSGDGTAEITIDPASTSAEGTEYYVLIAADAFDDVLGNSFAGISSTTVWSFTATGDLALTLTDDLVSYWRLDDNTTTSAVIDIHNSNPGTVANNENNYSSEQSIAGKINTAFDLDGTTNEYVAASSTGLPTGNNPRTLACWIKTNQPNAGVILNYGSGTGHEVFIYVSNWDGAGNFYVGFRGNDFDSGIKVDDDEWHFVVFTFNGSLMATYVDGVAGVSQEDTTDTATGSNFYIGRRQDGLYSFNGSVDEVAIWSRALTQPEITALYNGGAGLAYPFSTSTISLRGSTIRIKGAKVKIK